MPQTLNTRPDCTDPFPEKAGTTALCGGKEQRVLYHPGVGLLKLGTSDFNLWQGYKPGAELQPHYQTSAGLYATYQIEDARAGQMIESAFAGLGAFQAIRKAKSTD